MKKETHMVDYVTFAELVAVVIKGFRKILAITLIFTLLLGGYGVLQSATATPLTDEEYEAALLEYETTRDQLEYFIETSVTNLNQQREYNSKSLLMQVNPYQRTRVAMSIAISDVAPLESAQSLVADKLPVAYQTSRILIQYQALWQQLNLQEILKGTSMENIEEQYLREVIVLHINENGGFMRIIVDIADEAAGKTILDKIYAALESNRQVVAEGSYSHSFTALGAPVTQTAVDLDLKALQDENANRITTYNQALLEHRQALADLAQPTQGSGNLRSILIYVIIGAVIGCVLACIWVVAMHLTSSKITGTIHVTDRFNLQHLGSVQSSKGIGDKLAKKVQKERVWENSEQALAYLSENCKIALGDAKNVVLVFDTDMPNESLSAQIMNALQAEGRQISFVSNLQLDAQALSAVCNADAVILAAKPYVSKTLDMQANIATVTKAGKPICGFVLV